MKEIREGKRAREWTISLAECVAAAESNDAWMALFAANRAIDTGQPAVAEQLLQRGLAIKHVPHSVRVDLSLQAAMLHALIHRDAAMAAEHLKAVVGADPNYDRLAAAAVLLAEGKEPEARNARAEWIKSTEGSAAFTAYRRGGNEWALDALADRLGPPG